MLFLSFCNLYIVQEAEEAPGRFVLWGCTHAWCNSDYVAKGPRVNGMPAYQNQSDPNLWLYYATDKSWWVSDTESKNHGEPSGFCHTVEPHAVPWDGEATWMEAVDGMPQVATAITVSDVRWKEAHHTTARLHVHEPCASDRNERSPPPSPPLGGRSGPKSAHPLRDPGYRFPSPSPPEER